MKQLKATRRDLEHAVRDALYAQRLEERGVSPFKIFMELNEIVRNISASSTYEQVAHGQSEKKSSYRKT